MNMRRTPAGWKTISRSSFCVSSEKNRMPACRFGEHCDNYEKLAKRVSRS